MFRLVLLSFSVCEYEEIKHRLSWWCNLETNPGATPRTVNNRLTAMKHYEQQTSWFYWCQSTFGDSLVYLRKVCSQMKIIRMEFIKEPVNDVSAWFHSPVWYLHISSGRWCPLISMNSLIGCFFRGFLLTCKFTPLGGNILKLNQLSAHNLIT